MALCALKRNKCIMDGFCVILIVRLDIFKSNHLLLNKLKHKRLQNLRA